MPSTITRVVATRLRPTEVEELQKLARERGLTLSGVIASIARDTLHSAA